MIASSVSAEIRCGDECGRRERSTSPAGGVRWFVYGVWAPD
jgi:hypothetical protein